MLSSVISESLKFAVFLTIAGLVMGSFIGTLVLRLPTGQSIIFGRSRCGSCGDVLRVWQLLPLVGWVLQLGRCRTCKSQISLFYPGIELGGAGVCIWALLAVPPTILIPTVIFGWLLLALAVMDWRAHILADVLVYPLLAGGLLTAWCLWPQNFDDHLIGTTAGLVTFFVVGSVYRQLRNRDGLGLGDVKLFGAIGAWLGWVGLPSVLIIATGSALAVLAVQRVTGTVLRWDMKLAFGSYLCFGAWIVWLYGPVGWG